MPASTLRAWVLGIFWAIVFPGMNQFLYFRYPSVSINGLVAQLIVYPFGRAWARFMPAVRICGVSVNPGPFTIKEHVLVTVMAGVGASSAYATGIVAVQRVYYNTVHPFSYQWLLVMSTQLIGFSMGGIARRFLVSPPSMIWPNTLVQCALFNTLHSQTYSGIGSRVGKGITREMYFLWVFVAAVIWYFVPGYLFQGLRYVCWIAPNNAKVNQLFGYKSGLGFSILTFDWNQIAYIGSPLATPWWAEANVAAGFLIFYWGLAPILYYKNVFNSQYLPMTDNVAYDDTAMQYNHTRILNAAGDGLDATAYDAYSPVYLPICFALSYGLAFASIASTIPHSLLYFSKPIVVHFKRSLREPPDVHAKLMKVYPQSITFAFACLCTQLWPGGLTIWALVIALLIGIVYVIPIGMIQAVTNRQIGLNVMTELIIGFILPGKPTAMMMYTYGYISMSQAMQFTADLKLGHYMKIPPRSMFWCQIVSTMIAGTVQLGVQSWLFSNIPDICTPTQANGFTCPSMHVFATASIIWGLVGPGRVTDADCVALCFFFVLGALLPIILWGITRKWRNTILNYVNFPLIFSGIDWIPPAGAVNYVPWAIIGFLFQYVVRRRAFSYWAKYNYVLSAALDAGTGIGVILVFFCLQYPLNGRLGASSVQNWWGNTVFRDTYDWKRVPLRGLGLGQKFGSSGPQMSRES
ncbi:OPT superfamily oligopeptide transporter [Cylindrobasidium torrendii FP15055 ss-10]|uniref:OPT superfamily oligopeptide transporter n=1 Tax=Cylindrobasidium torrendii FP15055 ss-10 TaxID=1314674 RepID=A0A0D7B7F1_9AGAR|nr:OPT superfamily oligopeptide transporter [Cylindrobasidium torrendii FP15055 ss-10]